MFSPLSGLLAPVLILAMSPDTPVDSVRLKIVGPNGQPLQGATVRIGDGPRKPTENAEIVIPFGGKRLSVTVYGPLPSHGGSPGYQEEVFEIPRSVEELHVVLQHHFFGTKFGCLASHVLRCESLALRLRARW